MSPPTQREEKRGDSRELMAMAEMRARLHVVSRQLGGVLPDQLANIVVGYAVDTRALRFARCRMVGEVVIEYGARAWAARSRGE